MDVKNENAVYVFEAAVTRLHRHVKAASYGLRMAEHKMTDLIAKGGPLTTVSKTSAHEFEELTQSLAVADETMTEVFVVALNAHFMLFLQKVGNGLGEVPPNAQALETALMIPQAFKKASPFLTIGLALNGAFLRSGALDKEGLDALGTDALEVLYPSGKLKLFFAGDKVGLSETHLDEMAKAYVEAARTVVNKLKEQMAGPAH